MCVSDQTSRFVQRQINQLTVRCVHFDKSCKWKGQISEYNNHLVADGGCEFRVVLSLCCLYN